jgi:Holliday junction DNA helicase RuvA
MIAHLRGSVHKSEPGDVSVDVGGVGYRVTVPLDVWDELNEGDVRMLWVSTYVREDRLELYGFRDYEVRVLFEEFLKLAGVGPKMAIELCAVPRSLLAQATMEENVSLLTSIKGVGKKTAEKLLLELKSLTEKKPSLLIEKGKSAVSGQFDQDAIAALTSLGYDSPTVIQVLKELPKDLKTTEDRVAAALRSL